MREIVSPLGGFPSPFGQRQLDPYAVLGFRPDLVCDFDAERYRTSGSSATFSDAITHAATTNATMVDSNGLLKWRPHNLALNSAAPATQSITVVSGAKYTVECTGVSIALSGAGTGTVTEGNPVTITASTTTLTLTVTGSTGTMWAYRSDLGGMVDNPDRGDSYVSTTSEKVFLPRRGHHVWDGSAWVNEGILHESEARTQLLHTTNALVTQSHTVTAVPHTLHLTGTGTVTLSGASTAGPLVGTGTGEENRVSLTFTPTAASLTLTVSGTVTDAQLEVGSTPSSCIPNLAGSGTVTRAAETLTIPAANMPWPTPNVIGPELVTNGTFDTDTTGWIAGNQGVITWSSGAINIAGDGGFSDRAEQSITTEVGKVYQVTADYVGGTTDGRVGAREGSGSFTFLEGVVSSSAETVTFYFVATTTSTLIQCTQYASGSGNVTYDNISVREIDPLSVSLQMEGRVTYADEGTFNTVRFASWRLDANEEINFGALSTSGSDTGDVFFNMNTGNVSFDSGHNSESAGVQYTPGVLTPFNLAARFGDGFMQGAADGSAINESTKAQTLPKLENADFFLGKIDGVSAFNGTIKTVRAWAADLGDTGIKKASS